MRNAGEKPGATKGPRSWQREPGTSGVIGPQESEKISDSEFNELTALNTGEPKTSRYGAVSQRVRGVRREEGLHRSPFRHSWRVGSWGARKRVGAGNRRPQEVAQVPPEAGDRWVANFRLRFWQTECEIRGKRMNRRPAYRPRKILVARDAVDCPGTIRVLERLADVPVEVADDPDRLVRRFVPAELTGGKKQLLLVRHRGRFLKPCPGRQSRQGVPNVCCDYFVINFATNCPMECTYCFLQGYLTNPYLTVFANLDDLLAEVAEFVGRLNFPARVGTGELTDSLVLDHLLDYGSALIELFARSRHGVLELKTKTDNIHHLLDLTHRGKTVLAWSLNPPEIQETDELKTATIEQRLAAAERAVRAGYPVGFHFDPLVWYPEWRWGYQQVIAELFDRIPPPAIAWVSLGALRMAPRQLEVMRDRFPKSRLPLGEFVRAPDGKLRYFKPVRLELYRFVLSEIRRRAPNVKIYLCMERPEVRRRVLEPQAPVERRLGTWLASDLPVLPT